MPNRPRSSSHECRIPHVGCSRMGVCAACSPDQCRSWSVIAAQDSCGSIAAPDKSASFDDRHTSALSSGPPRRWRVVSICLLRTTMSKHKSPKFRLNFFICLSCRASSSLRRDRSVLHREKKTVLEAAGPAPGDAVDYSATACLPPYLLSYLLDGEHRVSVKRRVAS
jgi:hypothetical protein